MRTEFQPHLSVELNAALSNEGMETRSALLRHQWENTFEKKYGPKGLQLEFWGPPAQNPSENKLSGNPAINTFILHGKPAKLRILVVGFLYYAVSSKLGKWFGKSFSLLTDGTYRERTSKGPF